MAEPGPGSGEPPMAPAVAGARGAVDAPLAQEPPTGPAGAPSAIDPQLVQQSIAASTVVPDGEANYKWYALRTTYLATRYPLVAVAVLLVLLSVPRLGASVRTVLFDTPVTGTLTLLLWALYAFPLIWLINRFDFFEREPSTLIAMALVWGGVIATSMAVSANQALFGMLTSLFGEGFTLRWGAALVAPTTEELLKAIGIVAVILLALRGIRSAVDGFVVGAMVGLGFQVVENFIYTGNLLLATGEQDDSFAAMLDVFFVRGIGSGLWSHAAYSGVVGLGIGYAVTRLDRSLGRRVFIAGAMLALGWSMHFLWNLPQLLDVPASIPPVLKAAVIMALLLIVVLRNQGRDSAIYTRYLESIHDPEIITSKEIEQLRTYRSREDAARDAARRGGEKARDAVRMLQRAQADLSVGLANGDVAAVAAAKRRVSQARSRRVAAELLPPNVGSRWGVASIWVSIFGVLVPVIGPLVAAGLAWIGLHEASSRGAGVATSVRAAWPVAGISLVVGLVLLFVSP